MSDAELDQPLALGRVRDADRSASITTKRGPVSSLSTSNPLFIFSVVRRQKDLSSASGRSTDLVLTAGGLINAGSCNKSRALGVNGSNGLQKL